MNDYGTLGFNTNIQYELTSDDADFIEYAANYIHETLKGNTDYVDNHILLNYESSGYLDVFICPLKTNNLTPDFLTSNGEWIIFCLHLKKKYEEEKTNEREAGD